MTIPCLRWCPHAFYYLLNDFHLRTRPRFPHKTLSPPILPAPPPPEPRSHNPRSYQEAASALPTIKGSFLRVRLLYTLTPVSWPSGCSQPCPRVPDTARPGPGPRPSEAGSSGAPRPAPSTRSMTGPRATRNQRTRGSLGARHAHSRARPPREGPPSTSPAHLPPKTTGTAPPSPKGTRPGPAPPERGRTRPPPPRNGTRPAPAHPGSGPGTAAPTPERTGSGSPHPSLAVGKRRLRLRLARRRPPERWGRGRGAGGGRSRCPRPREEAFSPPRGGTPLRFCADRCCGVDPGAGSLREPECAVRGPAAGSSRVREARWHSNMDTGLHLERRTPPEHVCIPKTHPFSVSGCKTRARRAPIHQVLVHVVGSVCSGFMLRLKDHLVSQEQKYSKLRFQWDFLKGGSLEVIFKLSRQTCPY